MITRDWTRSAAAWLLLGSASYSQQSNWQVTITDLGLLPGGTYASAYAINDTGKIVGMANDSTGAFLNVQWVNGQISTIPEFTGGAGLSVPEDLNDAGDSVGHQHVYGSINYAVWWDSQDNPSALPGIPGGTDFRNWAHAINGPGQIVGYSQEGSPDYHAHAVVWFQGAVQFDLGAMAVGTSADAYGINDLGAVVGWSGTASASTHAFLWQNGQFTDIGTWPGSGAVSRAHAINNHGVIVGLNANVASIWENGAVHALQMPPGVSAYTPAIDINDAGDIIATGSKGYPLDVGVLWRNGVPIDLGTLPGGTISRARRINAAGEVVGEANAADGYFHAVKWTIAGSPGTSFCFGDGTSGPCPCGNSGSPGHGCQNSGGTGGSILASSGVASLSADTLGLAASGERPTSLSIFLQGTTSIAPVNYGDGVRCTGGVLKRLYVKSASGGVVSAPLQGEPSVSARSAAVGDPIPMGATRNYQVYYRDGNAGFCPEPQGSTFNVSNAVAFQWGS